MNQAPQNPEWAKALDLSGFTLVPGTTEQEIRAAEAIIGFALPEDYREFLKISNGAVFRDFVLNPIDPPSAPFGTSVVEMSQLSVDPTIWPVLDVGYMGFGSDEVIGFRKVDLAANRAPFPMVIFWHESGEVSDLAPSFRDFLREMSHLALDAAYVPWGGRDVVVFESSSFDMSLPQNECDIPNEPPWGRDLALFLREQLIRKRFKVDREPSQDEDVWCLEVGEDDRWYEVTIRWVLIGPVDSWQIQFRPVPRRRKWFSPRVEDYNYVERLRPALHEILVEHPDVFSNIHWLPMEEIRRVY